MSTATQTPPGGYGRIIVSDNDQVMTINCNGAAVEVNGNDNTLTLLGTCLGLTCVEMGTGYSFNLTRRW